MDKTYNFGPYYVTPTSYKHLKLRGKKFNQGSQSPTMPGPVLFHTKEDESVYTLHFAQTLVQLNSKFANILFIGSDIEKVITNGMKKALLYPTFLFCKKHIKMILSAKWITFCFPKSLREEIMSDVFGSKSSKQYGLIDSGSAEEHNTTVIDLYMNWNVLEFSLLRRRLLKISCVQASAAAGRASRGAKGSVCQIGYPRWRVKMVKFVQST